MTIRNNEKRLAAHLEMSTSSFMVCKATSLSLSRVMEIIRSWDTNRKSFMNNADWSFNPELSLDDEVSLHSKMHLLLVA